MVGNHENFNVVLDTKKKWMHTERSMLDPRLVFVQTDGPEQKNNEILNGVSESKNLQGVGWDSRPADNYEFPS